MNELDKLRKMLDEAKIPYENYQELHRFPDFVPPAWNLYGEAGKWERNQIVYGRNHYAPQFWKFDAIYQYGSYGCDRGFIECWGELGSDNDGEPRVMTAEEAFAIIFKDYTENDNE